MSLINPILWSRDKGNKISRLTIHVDCELIDKKKKFYGKLICKAIINLKLHQLEEARKMEEEKKAPKKILKLKVSPDTTIEKVNSKLKSTSSISEFQAHISCHQRIADIFALINQYLKDYQELRKLEVLFDEVDNISLEHTIYQLNDLKQLTDVCFKFSGEIFFSKKPSQSMGSFLSSIKNLTTLKFHIDCELVDSEIELNDFYQSAISLRSIEFSLKYFGERSNILKSLMDGLRNVKSLESFSLTTCLCQIRAFVILEIIVQELYENQTIKKFNINFGSNNWLIKSDFTNLENLLISLPQLENLSVSAFEFKQSTKEQLPRLEDYFIQLTNLKELSLKINWRIQIMLLNLMESIAQMDNLKRVHLDIYIKDTDQINKDLNSFGQSLAKIQYLCKLNLEFSYTAKITIFQLLGFLLLLKSNKYLKELRIQFECQDSLNQQQKQDIDRFALRETIERLENLSLKIYFSNNFNDIERLNELLASIQYAQNIQNISISMYTYFGDLKQKQLMMIEDLFQNKTNLESINFRFKSSFLTQEKDILEIFEKLQQNSKLKKLCFEFNKDFKFIPTVLSRLNDSLMKLELLKDLKLSFGQQSISCDYEIEEFATTLSKLKLLESFNLDLSMRNVSLSTLNSLITSLRDLRIITSLVLNISDVNFYNESDEKRFGDSFKLPPKLTTFDLCLDFQALKYRNVKNLFEDISNLKSLEILHPQFHIQAQNDECIEINSFFSKLKNLKELVFHCFSISILYLISLIKELPKLRFIQIESYHQEISSYIIAFKNYMKQSELSQGDSNLREIISLELQSNQLFKDQSNDREKINLIIPSLFEKLSFLNEIKFNFNETDRKDFYQIFFQNIRLFSNLCCLKLDIPSKNQICTQSLIKLGTALTELKQLKRLFLKLDFTENNIIHSESQSFYYQLSKLVELEHLEVMFSFELGQLGEMIDTPEQTETLISLFQSLCPLKKLKSLQIVVENYQIEELIMTSLHQACSSLNRSLTCLVLFLPFVSDRSKVILRQSLLQLNKLQILKINIPQRMILKQQRRLVSFILLSDQYPSHYAQ